jgi:hypothetical protein
MKKRQPTTKIHLFLLILNLILVFFLFFGNHFGLMGYGQAGMFLAIILIFFLCLSQFVSFSENESQSATISTLEERLTESFKYIGKINLLVEELNDIFFQRKKYPRAKAELKKMVINYCERIYGISKAEWVLIRIINLDSFSTILEANANHHSFAGELDNKLIVRKRCGYYVISTPLSDCRNRVYCILPKDTKDKEVLFFITSVIGQLETLAEISLKS